MGQRYEGTLIIQTSDYYSPVGSKVLASLSNPASADDIANGKGLYDGNGVLLNGSFIDGWPLEISTEEDMDAFITLENVGRYVKYTGTSSRISGAVVPVNPLNNGDTITALYVNKNIQPDVNAFDWNNPDESGTSDGISYKYIYLFKAVNVGSTAVPTPFMIIENTIDNGEGLVSKLYSIEFKGGSNNVYMYCATATPQDFGFDKYMGITEWGWLKDSVALGEGVVVSDVKYQDIWGAYFSKDGQWTGGAKYTSGQVYEVIQNGDAVEFKAIQY